jgi:diadenosine tetraphosphatase ApaH/serine/threonine PP2A family protein phosphatase
MRARMSDERPLEEQDDVADAVEDDIAVPEFETGGGPDDDSPVFREPGWQPRTGAEQPWDPEDLAEAEGRDPTPENVARAREELDEDGPAAIDRTVP